MTEASLPVTELAAPQLSTPQLSTQLPAQLATQLAAELASPLPMALLGFGLGLLVSGLFFAGLAWGMQRALRSRHSALLLLLSFLLRSALLLGSALLLARHSTPVYSLPAFALAFFCVRAIALHHARRRPPAPTLSAAARTAANAPNTPPETP